MKRVKDRHSLVASAIMPKRITIRATRDLFIAKASHLLDIFAGTDHGMQLPHTPCQRFGQTVKALLRKAEPRFLMHEPDVLVGNSTELGIPGVPFSSLNSPPYKSTALILNEKCPQTRLSTDMLPFCLKMCLQKPKQPLFWQPESIARPHTLPTTFPALL